MGISGGYYIKARKIKDSWVSEASPCVRETWDYLLREANHSDQRYGGFEVKRGQLFRSFREIRDDLKWRVGYRFDRYSEDDMKHCMKLLRREGMIALTSTPRGNLITVLQYSLYQDPKNYEYTDESTYESTSVSPMIHQSHISINKNVKNERMQEGQECKETDIIIKKEIKEKMFSEELETAISDFIQYRKQKGKRYAMGPTAEKLFRKRIAAALPALREQRIIKEIENSIEKGYQSILYDWKPPVLAGQNKKDEYVEEIPEEKEETSLAPVAELEEISEEIPEETNFMSEEEWEEMATTHASELYEKFYNPITLQK